MAKRENTQRKFTAEEHDAIERCFIAQGAEQLDDWLNEHVCVFKRCGVSFDDVAAIQAIAGKSRSEAGEWED
jgi:hypothetical protein